MLLKSKEDLRENLQNIQHHPDSRLNKYMRVACNKLKIYYGGIFVGVISGMLRFTGSGIEKCSQFITLTVMELFQQFFLAYLQFTTLLLLSNFSIALSQYRQAFTVHTEAVQKTAPQSK